MATAVRVPRRHRDGPFVLDGARLGALYSAHSVAVLAFFARRTVDRDVALDLLAETFAEAFVDRRSFRGASDEAAVAWIFGIARNQLASYYRRGEIERRALERIDVPRPSWHAEDIERVEALVSIDSARRAVARRLGELSEEYRRAVELRIVEEREYAVIASELGISETLVRARVSRGLKALGRALEGELADLAAGETTG